MLQNVRFGSTTLLITACGLVFGLLTGCGGSGGGGGGGGAPKPGVYTGTISSTSGTAQSGAADLVLGADGSTAVAFFSTNGDAALLSGTTSLTTGAGTANQLSTQITGTAGATFTLGSSSGSGTVTTSGSKGTSTYKLAFTSWAATASSSVGAYLGTITFTAGPDSGSTWPIDAYVGNGNAVSAATFDPGGDGGDFAGTATSSGAFTLNFANGEGSYSGVTGSISASFATATSLSGTLSLSNGDKGTVALSISAPK